ncbi:MAG: inorganic phosphate transporter [Sphingobacteriales bacterium]|nr:inorganic phosphate transporter [Sphingobacteriales bacterium]
MTSNRRHETALLSASVWNLATWYFGIPASSSHGLIGGIIGAVIAVRVHPRQKMAGFGKQLSRYSFLPLSALQQDG